jgi:hypothetical protein
MQYLINLAGNENKFDIRWNLNNITNKWQYIMNKSDSINFFYSSKVTNQPNIKKQ